MIVSILVLVDLAREFYQKGFDPEQCLCFNPCFSGSCSRIFAVVDWEGIIDGFNPCFSGSCSRILDHERAQGLRLVSILVLVDLAHEYYEAQY
ncbi:hypothetical protein, partial [Methanosarcina mazei]